MIVVRGSGVFETLANGVQYSLSGTTFRTSGKLVQIDLLISSTKSKGYTQCSFSLTTFSLNGKLMQIEYALKAVQAGVISFGIKATHGVVLATEEKLTFLFFSLLYY